jgi:phosphopantothenoylcysteine decarboxylase/phosphopantothenate--cysteine ligase
MLEGMRVLVGITGGIAAYKIPYLVRDLTKAGAKVRVVMTQHARQFVAPLTLETFSSSPVLSSLFDTAASSMPHIDWPREADLMVVAPATANIIGKMAHGIADDLLSTMTLALSAPLLVVPAMNTRMYRHPAVVRNLEILRERGVHVLEPGTGDLACGEEGVGRMAEVEEILGAIRGLLTPKGPLRGKKVLVTAGPTEEPIDPVRVLSNRSSGKMGYALAEEAVRQGAEVTLISGPTRLSAPEGIVLVAVETAHEMQGAVEKIFPETDILIMAAAVGDFRVETSSVRKIKKGEVRTLRLVENPDILKTLAGRKKPGQFLIGFAAETDRLKEEAHRKLVDKGVDLMVANPVGRKDTGFRADTNDVLILDRGGGIEETGLLTKREIARRILDRVSRELREG